MMLLLCAAVPAAAQSMPSSVEEHIAAAQSAQAKEDCHTAAVEYEAAVRLMPRSGPLRSNLGVALYCDNQLAAAVVAFHRSLELAPTLAAPHLFLGLAAYRLGEDATASRELSKAVQLMPSDITAHLWLGYASLSGRESEKAVQQFQAVLTLQPENIDAHYALAQAYFEVGRERAKELQAMSPNGPGVRRLAAEQKSMRDEMTPARDMTHSQLGKEAVLPAKEEVLYRQAHEAEQSAQQAFQFVLDKAPESERAHQIMADVYSAQRKPDAAVAEYRKVIELNPTLPGVRLALANCLMQSDRSAEALTELQEERALQPASSEVLAAIGRVQLTRGEDAAAMSSLQQALRLPNPPNAAYLLLGKAKLRAGDAKGAIPLLRHAVTDGADAPTAYYLLARAYRSVGDRGSMTSALVAYHRMSQDEEERRSAAQITHDPKTLPVEMSAQEVRDADALAAAH